MSFKNLGLRTELLRAISDKGYTRSTPIQAKAIPAILDGRDILGGAQTGTGKTAAFALPILQMLSETRFSFKRPRALVIAPTRELAAQVNESFRSYGEHVDLRSTVVFGGVGLQPQIGALRRGVDILVATPGRLLDLVGRRAVDLQQVEYLVLDEADRMLDMGFIHDIRKILKLLPEDRQNLLFSATYSEEIKRLANGLLRNPVSVEVARRNTAAETVDQAAYKVGKAGKRTLLSRLMRDGDWQQVLVFTRTKHGANRLATQLARDGIETAAIHGNKSQSARQRALSAFKQRDIRALVATDVAARGLDIDNLPRVVNYELPNVPEDYVHRIGRTGRAGKEGEAISLVSEEEGKLLKGIERLLGRPIEIRDSDGRREERSAPSRRPSKGSRNGRGQNENGSRARKPRSRDAQAYGDRKKTVYSESNEGQKPRSRRRRRRRSNRETETPVASQAPKSGARGWKRFVGFARSSASR